MLNVDKEHARLRKMGPKELRETYLEVHGEESRSGNKDWLIKRILWRMQAKAEGDLSERAKRRALEIANDADLRLKAPKSRPKLTRHSQVKSPVVEQGSSAGTILTREYKGKIVQVAVRENGYEFEGEFYKSLSGVAKAITGSHCNGNLFFRLGKYGRTP